jgi:predicted nucleotide-binding protein (sugar kinase/HSP70/actin superfamily)
VLRAAFTKETDFFAERNIDYLDTAVTLNERNMIKRQMFEAWGDRLQLTEDESDFAIDQAYEALAAFDREMEKRGREMIEEIERDDRIGILLLARPYHNDPGLNHGILEEFQALGYPVLSMRSIPKDPEWLARYFADDLRKGLIESPLHIDDVWPENYSVNSVQKVWAAKFAARHPNIAVVDLSSFKCGHDAPTYGLIDSVIAAGNAPYQALHDVDANKPSGSIKIRVKTYSYTLMLARERLEDMAAKKRRLEQAIAVKKVALLEALAERQRDQGVAVEPGILREIEALRATLPAVDERDERDNTAAGPAPVITPTGKRSAQLAVIQ